AQIRIRKSAAESDRGTNRLDGRHRTEACPGSAPVSGAPLRYGRRAAASVSRMASRKTMRTAQRAVPTFPLVDFFATSTVGPVNLHSADLLLFVSLFAALDRLQAQSETPTPSAAASPF